MAICRNIQNDAIYRYIGDNKFINVVTRVEGVVDDETARKVFRINAEATIMINDYPIIEDLIKRVGLKFNTEK